MCIALFIAVFSLLSIGSMTQKSPTVDEPAHLFAGYSYLKWGDFRANPEHPPLAKLWAALPLVLMDIKDSMRSSPFWDLISESSPDSTHTVAVGSRMLFTDNNAERIFFYAKLQIVLLALVLGGFIYFWSREVFGPMAAGAALLIFCLDPNILAHSQIVHTDVPFTMLFFIGTIFFWRLLRDATWPALAWTALFFGLAAITKYAYLALMLVWGVLALWRIVSAEPLDLRLGQARKISGRWQKALWIAALLSCCLAAAYLMIWFAYGLRFHAIAGGAQPLAMAAQLPAQLQLRALVTTLIDYRLFPEAWIYGQLYVFNNLQREAYLLGAYSDHGFLLYFPVAFAVKTPLPTLLLFAAAIGLLLRKAELRARVLFLLVPIVIYFSLGVWSRINIGLRHILPIYPFIAVLAGVMTAELWQAKNTLKRGAVIVLVLWLLGSTVSAYPNFLSYFNELIGGAANGHKVLLDSNLDWGQDLKGLKRWMDANQVGKIQFLYFGIHDVAVPRYYGINAVYLPGSWIDPESANDADPAKPDLLAISVNHLYGHYLRGARREDFVRVFRGIEPLAHVGRSINVYSIAAAIDGLRRALKNQPNAAIAHGDLGSLLENQGRIGDAVEHYRAALSIEPGLTKALYNLGNVLGKQGQLAEAAELLGRAAQSSPLDEDIHYDLGIVLAMQGDWPGAAKQFRETLKLDKTYLKAMYNLAVVLEKSGDNDGAIAQLRQAIQLDSTYTRAVLRLGSLLLDQGRLDEAVVILQRAIQMQPNRADAYQALARALTLQGKVVEAGKLLERVPLLNIEHQAR